MVLMQPTQRDIFSRIIDGTILQRTSILVKYQPLDPLIVFDTHIDRIPVTTVTLGCYNRPVIRNPPLQAVNLQLQQWVQRFGLADTATALDRSAAHLCFCWVGTPASPCFVVGSLCTLIVQPFYFLILYFVFPYGEMCPLYSAILTT